MSIQLKSLLVTKKIPESVLANENNIQHKIKKRNATNFIITTVMYDLSCKIILSIEFNST